jgi:hypothetical protein
LKSGSYFIPVPKLTSLGEFNKTARINWLRGGTVYARTSTQEYFAENFAMYIFHNAILSEKDADGYAMIERALSIVGLGVNPL